MQEQKAIAANRAANCGKAGFLTGIGLLAILMLSIAPHARSQSSNAQLSGTVSDPSGAIIPGASVKLTGMATGVSSDAITNSSGQYTFPFVAPGTYSVTVNAKGFATAQENGINLQVGRRPRHQYHAHRGL